MGSIIIKIVQVGLLKNTVLALAYNFLRGVFDEAEIEVSEEAEAVTLAGVSESED